MSIVSGYQWFLYISTVILIVIFFTGIRIVRPTHRGLIVRPGKYVRFAQPGFHWIIPVIEKMYVVNVKEQMVDAEPQAIKPVNEAANQYFVGIAQLLKRIQMVEESLKNNSKIVVPAGSDLVNVMGKIAGIIPLKINRSE